LERARAISRGVEMETTARAAEAIIALELNDDDSALTRFLQHVYSTMHLDAFVAAYRAHPQLLLSAAAHPTFSELVADTLFLVGDYPFALSVGLPLRRRGGVAPPVGPTHGLSSREREVLGLIALGLSNDAIARRLYISTATVKVHVRHIFEKLGVHSRTEAALKFRSYPMQPLRPVPR
jgi:DNA-binding NarL/FixJ family response regulator